MLDASVAVHVVTGGTLAASARRRLSGTTPVAPSLIDTEVMSALARLERGGHLTSEAADDALAAWTGFPCDRLDTTRLMPHVWALRGRVRVADAQYVALAAALDAPLLTADRRLVGAHVPGVSVLLVQ
ncbi:type II toxin-antitoxin system VapC family toxin [Cellulomonas sp. S1-8]|uniref:type II toxin-antitoxin system VapC family toxin n=1 Tax=Cellulomonas sp. S1-8 TaxID=2904790 RepID=UPI00224473BF|nr:type II toxin-antitoxin system VapC family toxin [Cellulomonas sp. S1-8]UZN02678.1 type II toxin-antitoxin system VapC family toxin [Cellulomonas sp. S1-8]